MVNRVDVAQSGLDRRDVVASLLKDRGNLLVVTGLGSPTYDVHAAGDHDGNYYLWGAMGGAALVGLGLAQAQPQRTILVITGDGEQLMGMGGLATIGVAMPANLKIVVLDNRHYGETGMQESHTGAGLRLEDMAKACGMPDSRRLSTMEAVGALRSELHHEGRGACLYVVEIKADAPPRSLPSRDAVYIKNRLRQHLGFEVA
jgi:thiamine pyrophosphate-dependent acetolactate synthase large subunit-like protein